MTEMHREGHIGKRQRVAARVGSKDGNRCGDPGMRMDVHPDHIDTKPVSHLLQHETGSAAHIQDSTDR